MPEPIAEAAAFMPLLYGDEDAAREALAVFTHQELLVVAWAAGRLAWLANQQIENSVRTNRAAEYNERR